MVLFVPMFSGLMRTVRNFFFGMSMCVSECVCVRVNVCWGRFCAFAAECVCADGFDRSAFANVDDM